jgi:hypothetical protein
MLPHQLRSGAVPRLRREFGYEFAVIQIMMVTVLTAEEVKRLGAAAFWPLFRGAAGWGRGPNVQLSPGWSQVAMPAS